nr:MAG TPA: hypothetical protein [Caudoviricetes sp.]
MVWSIFHHSDRSIKHQQKQLIKFILNVPSCYSMSLGIALVRKQLPQSSG